MIGEETMIQVINSGEYIEFRMKHVYKLLAMKSKVKKRISKMLKLQKNV